MQAIVQSFLALLARIAPDATTSVIADVINLLAALIPVLVKEYQDMLPIVQNVITVLQQNGDITEEQWNALDAMSTQYDADFKAALAAAKAEDAAAGGAAPS
jgi:hypothetical protein